MIRRLIYRRPLPAHSHLSALCTEFSPAELLELFGRDNTDRMARGDVIIIGNYAAVDLVAFFEACCDHGNHDASDGASPATYGPGNLIIMDDPLEVTA
ncbi:MAG: hypothetical protein ACRCYS_15790 [Beijerinckiaceae bacterium]